MRTHAHLSGRILCGQANASNVPLDAFLLLPEARRCRRCDKHQAVTMASKRAKLTKVFYSEANYGLLREALEGLERMYARTWDRVDGALIMMPENIPVFEEAHRKARIALGIPLVGDLDSDSTGAQ